MDISVTFLLLYSAIAQFFSTYAKLFQTAGFVGFENLQNLADKATNVDYAPKSVPTFSGTFIHDQDPTSLGYLGLHQENIIVLIINRL